MDRVEAKGSDAAAAAADPVVGSGERLLLGGLLLLAAVLRGVGLRREFAYFGPFFDELHNFVQPVNRMWQEGTADPQVYGGYAGFFNWLIFVPVTLARETLGLEAAYVAARAVVAVAGVVGVALAWAAARAAFGPAAGLLAAALVCVSRGQVREAHFVSPDVVVATLGLALLALLARPATGGRRLAWTSGAVLGLATAIKYTGLMLGPALLAGLWRRGWRAALAAGAAAALCFALAAPYAVAEIGSGGGLTDSVRIYYGPRPEQNRVLGGGEALDFAALLPPLRVDLGDAALLLAVAAPLLWRPRSALLAPAVLVLTSVAAMAPANLTYPRHALPATAAAAVLAAAGYAGLMRLLAAWRWRRVAAVALAVGVLAAPTSEALSLAARFTRPSAPRQAAGWIEERIATPARVATSLYGLPLDSGRFEVRQQLELAALEPRLACRWDVVVAREGELDEACFQVAARFASLDGLPDLLVLRPGRRATVAGGPKPDRVRASAGGDASRAADGDRGTAWAGPPGPGWVELAWAEPLRVDTVWAEAGPGDWPQRWILEVALDDGPWRRAGVRLRPRYGQRVGAPNGQIFALEPARHLSRLRLSRPEGESWSVTELGVEIAPP